jgi:FkbM family methyltransferase
MFGINKLIKSLFFGKKTFQPFFRWLFGIAIEGMNIGTGGGSINNGESKAIEYCLKSKETPVVFDVGAQGGDYSLEVLKAVSGEVKIYAFEPREKDFDLLKEELKGKVEVFQIALSDVEGERDLFYPKNISGMSSFHTLRGDFTESEKVKTQTIDSFCESKNIKEITLLKLDIEGHELSCLRGAKIMLPNIKYIQFEFGIPNRDARVYFKDIFEYLSDYKIYRILKDGLFEIKDSSRMDELLFTTNFLAERK